MVNKVLVLRGVEHLQQRRGRIALIPTPELVDFVEHYHGIVAACCLECLHNFPGHGANISATMALNFRHVCHATDAEAEKFASERRCNALADRCFAHSRRAVETNDFALHGSLENADGNKLEDAIFDVFHGMVVAVQNITRTQHVKCVCRRNAPWNGHEPIQVRTRHAELGRGGLKHRDFLELLLNYFFGIRRRVDFSQFRRHLADKILLLIHLHS
mmetsp:Transcript_51852/g.83726  ORF Transcript_51852/g.83726 Transcript_51852/m.83726 type:complete len:216 (-) Transcript_51852:1310-1957(-)